MGRGLDYCYAVSPDESTIFFVSGSLFGKVDVLTGNVEFIENHMYEMGNGCIAASGEKIYALSKDYRTFVEYDVKKTEYNTISIQRSISDRCCKGIALFCLNNNKIFVLPRYSGVMMIYDVIKRKTDLRELKVEGSILWACSHGESVYIITENQEHIIKLFSWDMVSGKLLLFDFAAEVNIFKSKSALPIHHMLCDEKNIYFFDSRNIFRADIETKRAVLLYTSPEGDIGHRIALAGEYIIIPPWDGSTFSVVNKNSGIVEAVKNFSDILENRNNICSSKISAVCEDKKEIFWIISNSDMMLQIRKDTLEFKWTKLIFNEENIKDVIREKKLLYEDLICTGKDFLTAVSKKNSVNIIEEEWGDVGKKIYES